MVVADPAAGPTTDAVIAFCRKHVSAYKVPRRVIFVDQLPLSPIGKVLKRRLRISLQ